MYVRRYPGTVPYSPGARGWYHTNVPVGIPTGIVRRLRQKYRHRRLDRANKAIFSSDAHRNAATRGEPRNFPVHFPNPKRIQPPPIDGDAVGCVPPYIPHTNHCERPYKSLPRAAPTTRGCESSARTDGWLSPYKSLGAPIQLTAADLAVVCMGGWQ